VRNVASAVRPAAGRGIVRRRDERLPVYRLLPAGFYYGWVMVGSALVINTVAATLNPIIFSFFIDPMSDDLGVGASALSWALTLRLITAGVTGPFFGALIDRHGARWLGAGCALLAGTMIILLAAAQELWMVYLVFAISGIAGFGGPSGQLLTQVPLAKWFVAKRGRALAIATAGLGGGTALTIPLAQWLIDGAGWRETYIIFGVAMIAIVVPVSLLFVRRAPEDMGLHPDGAAEAADPNAAPISTVATEEEWTPGQALRSTPMWLLLAALGLTGVALTGTLVHRVHFWEDLGMSSGLVGLGTALDPLSLVVSVFLFGALADRIPIRYLGAVGLAGMAASVMPMILSDGQAITIVLHNVLWGLSAGAYITLNNLVWPNYYGRQSVGAIRGIVLPVSIAASGIGAPLYGYLLDAGIEPGYVWGGSLVVFAVSALLVLIARPPRLPQPPATTPRYFEVQPAS